MQDGWAPFCKTRSALAKLKSSTCARAQSDKSRPTGNKERQAGRECCWSGRRALTPICFLGEARKGTRKSQEMKMSKEGRWPTRPAVSEPSDRIRQLSPDTLRVDRGSTFTGSEALCHSVIQTLSHADNSAKLAKTHCTDLPTTHTCIPTGNPDLP